MKNYTPLKGYLLASAVDQMTDKLVNVLVEKKELERKVRVQEYRKARVELDFSTASDDYVYDTNP